MFPAFAETQFKCGCLIKRQLGDGIAARIFEDTYRSTVQFWVHEKVTLIHVPLYQSFVLLRVPSTNDQVVLTCDKPDVFFKPKDLTLDFRELLLLEFS